jgi:hypothetical protein
MGISDRDRRDALKVAGDIIREFNNGSSYPRWVDLSQRDLNQLRIELLGRLRQTRPEVARELSYDREYTEKLIWQKNKKMRQQEKEREDIEKEKQQKNQEKS